MQLLVTSQGIIRCLYGEQLDLHALGELSIARGSHVEPTSAGNWTADLAPVGGPCLGPFAQRSEALQAEEQWLLQHWLHPPQ